MIGVSWSDGLRADALLADPVPKLDLKNLGGKSFQWSDFQGNVVLLNFWATWCPPCLEELPSLEALNHSMKSKPFSLVAISVDKEEGVVRKFLAELSRPLTFLVLLDPSGESARRFGTDKFPESYLIGNDGRLIKKYVGALDWMSPKILDEIDQEISKAGKKSKSPPKSQ